MNSTLITYETREYQLSHEKKHTVSILGTLPPIRALSSYCFEFANSMALICGVEFISFKKIYPVFLYPGGRPDDDHTYPEMSAADIKIRRRLTWYNPLSWFIEGIFAKGDILHAQWWSFPLFFIYLSVCACFRFKKKPVVFTVHNVMSHEKSFLFFKISGFLFKLGDHFIVHSDINKQQLAELYHIPPEKISVIAHGSLDFHVKKDINRKMIRKEFEIEPNNRVILLFGAIRPYKGIDTALKAFAKIVKKIPEARLLIAGRLWEDWTPYKRLIADLGLNEYVITHLDYIPSGEVYKFFEVADICVFPYHHFDSQSGAGLAAISFHKPMIVSAVGGLADLVKDSRFIVPPADYFALASAVTECLLDPALLNGMILDAEAVAKRFSWSEIANKTEKIYENLLKQHIKEEDGLSERSFTKNF